MYKKKQRSIRIARHPPFKFKQMITFPAGMDKLFREKERIYSEETKERY